MPQFLRSLKLYLVVVLLPQLIYLLTRNSHGLAAVCESCSPSNYIDLYLRLLQDPSTSFSHESTSTDTPCANSDEASSLEYIEKTVSEEDLPADEYRDSTVAALCSCSSRESSNLSIEEAMAVQESSHGAQTMDGGW